MLAFGCQTLATLYPIFAVYSVFPWVWQCQCLPVLSFGFAVWSAQMFCRQIGLWHATRCFLFWAGFILCLHFRFSIVCSANCTVVRLSLPCGDLLVRQRLTLFAYSSSGRLVYLWFVGKRIGNCGQLQMETGNSSVARPHCSPLSPSQRDFFLFWWQPSVITDSDDALLPVNVSSRKEKERAIMKERGRERCVIFQTVASTKGSNLAIPWDAVYAHFEMPTALHLTNWFLLVFPTSIELVANQMTGSNWPDWLCV